MRLRHFIVLCLLVVALTAIPYGAITKPPSEFDFDISVSPLELRIKEGEKIMCTVTVTLTHGSAQPVSLTTSTPPKNAHISSSLSPSSGIPTFSSTLTVIGISDVTEPVIESLIVTGNGEGKIHSITVMVTISSHCMG
jgi:hypothetical protein